MTRVHPTPDSLFTRPWSILPLDDVEAFNSHAYELVDWFRMLGRTREVELVVGPGAVPISLHASREGVKVSDGVTALGPWARIPLVQRCKWRNPHGDLYSAPTCGIAIRRRTPEISAWCNRLENRMAYD